MPAPLALLYCVQADVESLLSSQGVLGRLDDQFTGVVTPTEQNAMTNALNYATSKVNYYLQPLYAVTDLATSWLVWEWAVVIAAAWLAGRRGNPVPDSLKKNADGCIKDMEDVRKGFQQLPDIGYRTPGWPAWSNVRVDPRYRLRQIRVETPISENTPVSGYSQNQDWQAMLTFEI